MNKRYKLVIADDDAIIRRGVSQLINWGEHHFDIVAYASDGEKAWEVIQNNHIDIVVSDIKMPFMDGIQLLEKIQEHYPNIKTILLTGYEDFEYARKAIKHKAFDYLLKPVDGQQLLETVQRAAYHLEESQKIQDSVNENMETKRKNFYCKLLQGTLTSQEVFRQASILEVPIFQNGLSLTMDVFMDIYSSKEELKEGYLVEIRNLIIDTIEHFNQQIVVKSQGELKTAVSDYKMNQIEILLTTDKLEEEPWKEKIKTYAKQLLEQVENNCGCTVTIGLGTVQPEITGLHNSYIAANNALKNRHIYGENQVIDGSMTNELQDGLTEITLPSERLLQHIRLGFQEEVTKDVEAIFADLYHTGYISLESARMIATELAIICFKAQTAVGDGVVSYLYFLNEIQKISTIEELKHKVLELAVQITVQRGKKQTTQRQLAEDGLRYIREHYSDEALSLGDLANQFHVSQTYMSIVFKQETEINFSAHLLKMRMEKAMELLRGSDVKHYEVAEQVGYSNSQYFAVCFKKYTGMTPTQFKEQ